MMNNSLITVGQLKELTIIQTNVDAEALIPYLSIAEDLHLRNILGENLYADVRMKYEAGELVGIYETLYKYIVPVLAYYAMWEYLPFSYIKITNKGLEKKVGTNQSEPVAIADLNYLRSTVLSYAKAYSKELVDLIESNLESFPLYKVDKCIEGSDTVNSGKRSLGGMFFPK